MIKHIIIALSIISGATAYAEESDAKSCWSLDSCITYAVSHNLTVKAREYEQMSGELALGSAKDKYLPRANAFAGQNFAFGRGLNSSNTYSDRNTSTFSWGAQMDMPIFQGLSTYRSVEQAKTALRRLVYETEATKDDVTLNVISQYLQVLYCEELTQITRLQLDLSMSQLARRTNLLEAGKIAELDVIQAQSQVAQDELAVVTSENDRAMALIDLAQLLQLPDTTGFNVSPLSEEILEIMNPDEVYASALRNNSSILAARTGIKLADKTISLARTGYLPTLSFNAGLGSSYYHLSGLDNDGFGSQMRNNFSKTVGFSLSVPLFDAFSTRRNISRAKIQRLEAELQLENRSTALYKSIRQAHAYAIGAEKKRQAAEVAVTATRKALEAMTVKYECGRANATELEQAKSEYIRSLTEEVQARYEATLRNRILRFYDRR